MLKTKNQEKSEKTMAQVMLNLPDFLVSSRASKVARHYGFIPIEFPPLKKTDIQKSKLFKECLNERNLWQHHSLFIDPKEKSALIKNYFEGGLQSMHHPLLVYYEGDLSSEESKKFSLAGKRKICLEILGSTRSVSEAILLKTAVAILKDEGEENLLIEINSVGDKDSISKFTKELSIHYKKNIDALAPSCRDILKEDVMKAYLCAHEKCAPIRENAPTSISFLSEPHRKHFMEVMEFIERMSVPYRIKNSLIGNRNLCNHTIFEIRLNENEDGTKSKEEELLEGITNLRSLPLAVGIRYNGLAKKMEYRKDVPAVGVSVLVAHKNNKRQEIQQKVFYKRPQFYFVQLGAEAKLQSLELIEFLRENKIPIHQSLHKDKLALQLTQAEGLHIPYILIMGQKEAVEKTILVRNMETRAQETIPIYKLAGYLKNIPI